MPGRLWGADAKCADGNSASPGGATQGAEMRVLIAHSSSAARMALEETLSGYTGEPLEMISLDDGHDALEVLLAESAPEVAFVDWDLPGIEGPEMCRLVRDFHHGEDTYLVVLASAAHQDTADAWRAGAAKCISTPAPAGLLRDCLHAGLRAARRQHPDDDAGRPTLDAVRTADMDQVSPFFRDDDPAPRPAASDRCALLQAVLVER
jgi:CheY-like chemotaxis protein